MVMAVQSPSGTKGGAGGPTVAGGDDIGHIAANDDSAADDTEEETAPSNSAGGTGRTSATDIPWAIAMLHLHWFQLGGGEPVERRLIEPASLKTLLPFLQLIEFETTARNAAPRLRYRLTGTQIDHIHGRNLTGLYLDELEPDDGSGVVPFLQRGYTTCYRSAKAYIGHHDWNAPPRDGLVPDPDAPDPDAPDPYAPDLHALPRRLRLWLGAFPLLVDGRIGQCLSIETYEGLTGDSNLVPWLKPGDGFSGG